MRFQSFAVIFIAIILPISMVLSYYIQMKSDTISLETKYESKLNNATYAAVSAYQMNSLNTQRVAGESILNYVEASVNTFHTTLATSMLQSNASKNRFKSFIPAILFTTYDGYYIYSPYKAAVPAVVQVKTPISATDTLAADNGQTILSADKEVVYMKDGTNTDYRIDNSDTINNKLRKTPSEINDRDFTTKIENAKMDYSYKLKPFIYYSCRYSKGNTDFVASYSLDNYLTLYGQKDGKSFSKAGYGINPEEVDITGNFLVKTAKREAEIKDSTGKIIRGASLGSFLTYDNSGSINIDSVDDYYNDIENGGSSANMKFELVDYAYIKDYINDYSHNSKKGDKSNINNEYYYAQVDNNEYDLNADTNTKLTRYQTGDNIIEDTINLQELFKKHKRGSGYDPEQEDPWDSKLITLNGGDIGELRVTYKDLEITDPDAKKYYIKAKFFSLWVNDNLGAIQEKDVKPNAEIQDALSHDIQGNYDSFSSDTKIFYFDSNNDPSSEISPFFTHKTSVIKNSIQQNLNAAISNFNADRQVEIGTEYTFRMPVLNSSDWDSILNNVCMVSFMQGIPTGYNRIFNSYAIVKSTNNNTFVTPSNLYFTEEIGREEQSEYDYHRLDCPKLDIKDKDYNKELEGDRSAEFKYDALRINSIIKNDPTIIDDGNAPVIAFEDDTTHTFYEANLKESEWVIGKKIDKPEEYTAGNLNDTNKFVTGSLIKYLFDHQNIGCYDCIISGNHDSCVQYYAGNLWPTGKTKDTKELLMEYNGAWYYLDGNKYTGTPPERRVLEEYGFSVAGELAKRRQALFNMLGKFKETQYKSNDYINR